MNILFILPSAKSRYFDLDYHHGVAQLSAQVRQSGHGTALLQLARLDRKAIDRKLAASKPDLLAFSFASDSAGLAKEIMQYTKKYGIYTIAGGVHATVAPEEVINWVDVLCLGEGENALVDVINGVPLQRIANLWAHQNGELIKNAPGKLLHDLDALPFSDRSLFDYQRVLDKDHRADFMAGRGCPFRCSYCINSQLLNLAPGRFVRWRSQEHLIAEIKAVLSAYNGIESICFQDDTFALNANWLNKFTAMYTREIGLPFACNLRVGSFDEAIIDALAQAGCTEVRMGVEQGNDQLRRQVLHRNMDKKSITDAFAMAKKAGIKTFAYNMVGIPGETVATIQETIALNQKIKPDKLHVSMFRPYPGTELYDQCRKYGYLTSKATSSFFEPVSTVQLPTITRKELEFYFRIFRIAALYPRLTPLAALLAKCQLGPRLNLYDFFFKSALSIFFFLRSKMPKSIKNPIFRLLKA